MKLCEPKIPEKYWVNRFTCKCNRCGSVIEKIFPNGNDIVKLKEIDGPDEKWLPTFGKGGYLDLLTKLIPGHSYNDEVTVKTGKKFIKELNQHCEQGEGGMGFDFDDTIFECTNCNSKDTVRLHKDVLTNPPLSWLKISCHLME